MLADRYFGFPPLHKKANKVLQRWHVLAFYRIASCLSDSLSKSGPLHFGTKALFTRRQGNPTARVTLARGLKDSSGLQAKFSSRVTLLPETTLRLLRFGDLASKARTVNKTGKQFISKAKI